MSLINEALKKAQRQRTDPNTAPVPAAEPARATGGTAVRIAKRRPPMPARTLMILITGGGAVFLMACVLIFIYCTVDKATVTKAMHPFSHTQVKKPEPTPAAIPSVVLPPIVTVVPPATVKPTAVPTPTAPPIPIPEPIRQESVAPVSNPQVESFLSTLRVAGVRASETDPKVIMNDRIFRLNEIVDRATGLRLTHVDASTIEFTDARGFKYTKLF